LVVERSLSERGVLLSECFLRALIQMFVAQARSIKKKQTKHIRIKSQLQSYLDKTLWRKHLIFDWCLHDSTKKMRSMTALESCSRCVLDPAPAKHYKLLSTTSLLPLSWISSS